MKVTEVSGAFEHEGVVRCEDAATGLRSFIALHSTRLGPGLGGTRFFPFNTEEDALADVLKLSRAMTYKSAAAGLSFGGGKAVIVGDPKRDKTEALIRAYARFVDSLDGRHVAVQGVGKVGTYLVGHLVRDGCLVTVADVSPDAVRRVRADHAVAAVGTDDVHEVQCDIFSPCALGGSLNPQTIPGLRCEAVAGCANNQLASEEDAERLMSRGIVYAPDFIVNAGGVINISYEVGRAYDRDAAFAHVGRIGETLTRVLDLAGAERISTAEAAERVAVERIYSTRPNPSG